MRDVESLDGLRAISIGLVILDHLLKGGIHAGNSYAAAIVGNGSLGVTVFFVISGFLITHLLLREHLVTGAIGLRSFYVRRAFRILPAYYFYLAVVLLLASAGVLWVGPWQRTSAFLFAWDYFPGEKSWALAHLWSLSVEEQFYLLWPAALVLCLRRSPRSAQRVALFCIAAAPISRVLTYEIHSRYSTLLYYMLHTRVDALMIGCLAALSQGEAWFERVYKVASRYVYLLMGFALVISPILSRSLGGVYTYVVGFSAEGICIAVVMLWLIRNPRSLPGCFLNWIPVKWIGVLSYSLYLWQTIFLHDQNSSLTGYFPLNLVFVFGCALFSYFGIERPALSLRQRLTDSRRHTAVPRPQLVLET